MFWNWTKGWIHLIINTPAIGKRRGVRYLSRNTLSGIIWEKRKNCCLWTYIYKQNFIIGIFLQWKTCVDCLHPATDVQLVSRYCNVECEWSETWFDRRTGWKVRKRQVYGSGYQRQSENGKRWKVSAIAHPYLSLSISNHGILKF